MTDRPVLEPTAAHPITVEPTGKHVTVRVNGEVVADTDEALTLQEATYPAVLVHPPARRRGRAAQAQRHRDVLPVQGRRQLLPRRHRGGDTVDDAIWTYEKPYPAVGRSPVMSRSIRTRRTSPSHSLVRCTARPASCSPGRPALA